MKWIEDLAPYLSRELREALEALPAERKASACELRLHPGSVPTVFCDGVLVPLNLPPMTEAQLRGIAARMMEYTPSVHRTERQEGYLTLPGGYRVGLCGSVRPENGMPTLQEITTLLVRIHRRMDTCALPMLRRIFPLNGVLQSCLIVSPPGMGKTTLLASAAQNLSLGFEGRQPVKVAVADERLELACSCPAADALQGVKKRDAVVWLLRSLSPQVIVVDEIASAEEAEVIRRTLYSGVRVLASVHADSFADLAERWDLADLCRAFPARVLLSEKPGHIAAWETSSG